MKELIHKKGSIILCPNGHEVAELERDLHKGDINYHTAVVNWRSDQIPAKKGDKLPLCCWCGEPYFISGSGRFEYIKELEVCVNGKTTILER
jgi:glyoxylate utilization-related uncharacterized protein